MNTLNFKIAPAGIDMKLTVESCRHGENRLAKYYKAFLAPPGQNIEKFKLQTNKKGEIASFDRQDFTQEIPT